MTSHPIKPCKICGTIMIEGPCPTCAIAELSIQLERAVTALKILLNAALEQEKERK